MRSKPIRNTSGKTCTKLSDRRGLKRVFIRASTLFHMRWFVHSVQTHVKLGTIQLTGEMIAKFVCIWIASKIINSAGDWFLLIRLREAKRLQFLNLSWNQSTRRVSLFFYSVLWNSFGLGLINWYISRLELVQKI